MCAIKFHSTHNPNPNPNPIGLIRMFLQQKFEN